MLTVHQQHVWQLVCIKPSECSVCLVDVCVRVRGGVGWHFCTWCLLQISLNYNFFFFLALFYFFNDNQCSLYWICGLPSDSCSCKIWTVRTGLRFAPAINRLKTNLSPWIYFNKTCWKWCKPQNRRQIILIHPLNFNHVYLPVEWIVPRIMFCFSQTSSVLPSKARISV